MHDLRLVGVADDGAHVLMVNGDGTRFRLPLDEALRAAVRQDRPRLGQLQIEVGGLRPREVQALIRSGLSTQEVADRSGWTVEKVRKFEVPVLAEREYVANLARGANPGRDGRTPMTLEGRARERLRQRGVSLEHLAWDSARAEAGVWTVQLVFPAGGRERTAQWRFDPKARYLRAVNDDARWLSEDDDPEHGLPTPHRAGSDDPRDQVFDIEAGEHPGPPSVDELEDDLTDAVRAHSHAGVAASADARLRPPGPRRCGSRRCRWRPSRRSPRRRDEPTTRPISPALTTTVPTTTATTPARRAGRSGVGPGCPVGTTSCSARAPEDRADPATPQGSLQVPSEVPPNPQNRWRATVHSGYGAHAGPTVTFPKCRIGA